MYYMVPHESQIRNSVSYVINLYINIYLFRHRKKNSGHFFEITLTQVKKKNRHSRKIIIPGQFSETNIFI